MNIEIRKATLEDAADFLRIKDRLPLTYTDGRTTTGGFLLGTDLDTYRRYIAEDLCLVGTQGETVVGFGIMLRDESLKASEVWEKRHQATWNLSIAQFEHQPLCYFEQLAFLPGHGRLVIKLAYNLCCWAFELGHAYLFTTTVRAPVVNLAAVPYILKASGRKVGNIDEVYPRIGPINSDLYLIERKGFYTATTSSKLAPFLKASYRCFR